MNRSKRCQWEVVFRFPSPILEKSITNAEGLEFGLEFDTEKVEEGIILKGFSIITPILTIKEADDFAQENANRIFDYLSAIHNYPIEGYLSKMVELKPEGEVKKGYKKSSVGITVHMPEDLDFNRDSFKVLTTKKLARQLSHFRRGLKTDDVIEKIREFYLICEDEYLPGHQFLEDVRPVRHLLSHPELNNPKHIAKAKTLVGKKYLDPSDPGDVAAIKDDLNKIEKEAREIIKGKI